MKTLKIISFLFLLSSLFSGASLMAQSATVVFACTPCGCSEDDKFVDAPGECPECGMPRVATYAGMERVNPHQQHSRAEREKVAIFVFDGVQIIDFTGPYEVFGQAGMQVYTVGLDTLPIRTAMGMIVRPHYRLDNAPQADVLVLPGGSVNQHLDNAAILDWVKQQSKQVDKTLSVCNGAFYLARAGLLDGRSATTFAPLIPGLQAAAPKARIVSDERYVDNGNIVTSAGLSSGIDAALYVVSNYRGTGRTQEIATHLEYDWDPHAGYVRAALADRHLAAAAGVLGQFERTTLSFAGNQQSWTSRYLVRTGLSAAELHHLLAVQVEKGERWKARKMHESESSWQLPAEAEQTALPASISVAAVDDGLEVVLKVGN